MLQVKNLIKQYKAKGGVVTKALDDVSIVFPENGLVFLLGKSGSGKSTLLNVIGGLDKPDSGEIIIKGKNSKDFSSSDFDSYRNTFIGFIFQEYNILNEFNVEQNISLALQLQGKPNNKEAVDKILEQVDLKEFGKRKPNTLSGGQKQRVAIARALIKNPEIIMADEPTGALDSNTGKQIFSTLKELSKNKLIIVVSHDRDFAEIYGDRIIELADGKIISDTTKESVESVDYGNVRIINDHTISIKDASKINKDDLEKILESLKNQEGEAIISSGSHDLPLVKQAIHVNSDSSSEVFKDTKDIEPVNYDGSQTKFIKSHLPMGRSIKMGSSSLKMKPVRLIFTSILTSVALTMFGVASTLMLFKESYSVGRALENAPYKSELVRKEYKVNVRNHRVSPDGNDEVTSEYENYIGTYFDDEEVEQLNTKGNGLNFAGVYTFGDQYSSDNISVINPAISTNNYSKYANRPNGFIVANREYLNSASISLVGNYPANKDEVAISEYAFNAFKSDLSLAIPQDIIGKTFEFSIRGNINYTQKKFTISGVFNSNDIDEKYKDLDGNPSNKSNEELYKLNRDFEYFMKESFSSYVFVHKDFGEDFIDNIFSNSGNSYVNRFEPTYVNGLMVGEELYDKDTVDVNTSYSIIFSSENVEKYSDGIEFYDLDGKEIEYVTMNENDVYLPYQNYLHHYQDSFRNYIYRLYEMFDNSQMLANIYNMSEEDKEDLKEIANRLRDYPELNYPVDYNFEEDKTIVLGFINVNYQNFIRNKDLYDSASRIIQAVDYYNYPQPLNYATFQTYYYEITSSFPYNFTHFNEMNEILLSDEYENILYDMLLAEVVRSYLELGYMYQYLSDEQIDYYHNVADKFINSNQPLTDSDKNTLLEAYEICKQIVEGSEDYYPSISLKYELRTPSKEIATLKPKCNFVSFNGNKGQLNVLGYFNTKTNDYGYLLNKDFIKNNGVVSGDGYRFYSEYVSDYKLSESAKYSGVITPTTYSQAQTEIMLHDFGAYRYRLTNQIYQEMLVILSMISVMKTVFLIIGIVFGVFAALMLLNFIATSITSKTKEIGILRAVGARGSDLFKIFFSESGIISIICVVISIVASAIVCWRLNVSMSENVGIQLLDFGIINIALIIAGSLVIAFLGTFFPVLRAAKRQPVDSIRTL